MSLIQEFKTFALRGNVIDMAVGIIIGAAFGKIVTSLVSEVILPPLGLLIGGVTFTDLKWVMKEAVNGSPEVTLNYGNFLQVIFDFLIIAFAIFMFIKLMNTAQRRKDEAPVPAKPAEPSNEEKLLTEIRDLLKK